MKNGSVLTAVEDILLAAAELAGGNNSEFSEWELTVQAWKRNRNRFGLHGFEDKYPNHKRVSKEIMNKGPYNPIQQGWMTKVRANYYKLTSLGLAKAESLRGRVGETVETARGSHNVFDSLARYVEHRAFKDHCRNPEEPRTWLGAAAFLGISKNEPQELENRIRAVENTIEQTFAWMDQEQRDTIRRGPVGGSITIRRRDVERLAEFLNVLQSRFEPQMGAIRKKSG